MKRYINIHVNKNLFLDARSASRLDHLELTELTEAPTPGKCFQFKTKKSALNFLNALKSFVHDYPSMNIDQNRNVWIYDLGNTAGFKIDFPIRG